MSAGEVQRRFRLRVRYRKAGRLAYLGHLEVMHSMERIIRRAGLPFEVTQGFSPRMKAAYSSALPVGTSSECEYLDVFLTELVPREQALARLRAAAPDGLMPLAAGYVDPRAPALTAAIGRVGYRVELHPAEPGLDAARVGRALGEVRESGSIRYRRGKKDKVLDLDRFLVEAVASDAAGRVLLELDTRTTNDGSLRPEVLLAALDRCLCGGGSDGAPIESTGMQDYRAFARVDVCRSFQRIEAADGSLIEPLPETASAAPPPRSATG